MTHNNTQPLETQEISLRLEGYDDIFSDFDIRPYSKRALSTDFLDEIKRAARDKNDGGIELTIHLPKEKRNESDEAIIAQRLAAHFNRHYQLTQQERRKIIKLGIGMVLAGSVFTVAATLIVFKDPSHNLFLSFLVVFLEPAAWFSLWEGLNEIIFNSNTIKPELDFYRKMSDSHGHTHFTSY